MSVSQNTPQLLQSNAENLTILYVRGKYIISTMPADWIYGQANTLLECYKCMANATWRGVLIGACEDCQGKYGEPTVCFFEKETEYAMPGGSTAAPFGFYSGYSDVVCQKIDELMDGSTPFLAEIPSQPKAINHEDAYSFYGMAAFPNYSKDVSLMLDSPFAIDILSQRYNCDAGNWNDQRWHAITCAISELSEEFDSSSKPFFKKCERMEKEWIECTTATSQEEVKQSTTVKESHKKIRECDYCGIKGKMLLCGSCKAVRYCSPACQSRDWTKGGAYMCANGVPSDPHKASCAYLTNLRLEQAKYEQMMQYEQMMREARDDRDEAEYAMEEYAMEEYAMEDVD